MSMKAGLKIFLFFLFSISIAGATFPVGIGLQLDDILYNQNGSLVTLGNLTVTVWDSPIGGNLIYNESVQGAVKNGSVNIMLGELASLDLDYGVKYYYDMAINGEDIDFIDMSGGAQERQYWYSPVGQIQSGSVNMTSFGVYWNKTGGDLNPSLFENINMMLANIYNVTNVTANRFIGDGSLLNNITADSFNISADEWLYFNSPTNTKGLRYNLTGNKFEFVNATLYVPNIISANYVDAELGYFNYLQMGYKGYSTGNPFTIINTTGTPKLSIDFSGDLTFLDTADNQYITWDELGGQTAGIGVWNYGAYHSLELWSGFDAEDTIELYNPTNVWGNLTVIGGNATADYFIGDGSLLTNLPTGAQYWNRTGTTLFTTTVGDNVNLTGNLAVDYDVFIKDNSVIYFTTAEDEYLTFTPVNLGSFALSHNLNIPVNDSYCWGDPINGHCITYNGSSVNFGDNVTAPYFIGDGRLLTNLPNQSQYWNRSGNVIQPSVFGDKAYLTGNVTMRSYNRFCLDESESVCFFYNSSYGYIDSGNNAWQYASLIVSQIRVHDGLGNSSDIYYNGTNFEFMNDVAVYGNLLADNVSAGNFFGNINWSYVQNAPSFLTSESDPLWSANYSLFNSSWSTTYNSTYDAKAGAGNCPAGQVVMNTTSGGVQCVTLVIIESDPLWSANYSLFNSSWSTTFNSTYNALIGEPLWSANYSLFNSSWSSTYNATYDALAGEPLWSNNYSLFNSSWSATYNATYNALIGEPLWSANYSAFNNSWSSTYNSTYDAKAGVGNCPAGQAVMNTTAGGVQCVPITVTESDPLWSANYSLFNSSWSTTYNATYAAWNKTYADTLYSLISEPLWSANYSLFNNSWSATYNSTYNSHTMDSSIHFLMTAIPHNVLLNLSWENSSHFIRGNIPVNFNSGGAAVTVVYNTTTARLELSNNTFINGVLNVNGNAVPNVNATYSLGNSTNLWKNLYVNDTVYFNNNNITYNGSSFVASSSFYSSDFNTNETKVLSEYQPYFRLTGGTTGNSIVLETTGTRVIHNRFAQSGGSPQTGTGYHRFSTSNNFVSWSNASNVLHLYYRSNDATTVFTATLYVNGVADGNINGVTWSPALANTWYEYQRNASSSPSPGDFVNLEVSWTGNSAADNGDLADVHIYYKEYVL